MRPTNNMRKSFRKLYIPTSSRLDEKIHDEITRAIGQTNENIPAKPVLWRIIMKSKITKLAAAAVIIITAIIIVNQFGGLIDGSSVVWAEVVEKVEASRGTIFRSIETNPTLPTDYAIRYNIPKYSRTDYYVGEQIYRSYFDDFETMIFTVINHNMDLYIIMRPETMEEAAEGHQEWMNPKHLLQTILSCEYEKLGQKTIEGVLCEGIETTDPAFETSLAGAVDRLEVQIRLWVNVQTQYPVRFERKVNGEVEGEVFEKDMIMDQFQWDVELDPGLFEPIIPPDYMDATPPAMKEQM